MNKIVLKQKETQRLFNLENKEIINILFFKLNYSKITNEKLNVNSFSRSILNLYYKNEISELNQIATDININMFPEYFLSNFYYEMYSNNIYNIFSYTVEVKTINNSDYFYISLNKHSSMCFDFNIIENVLNWYNWYIKNNVHFNINYKFEINKYIVFLTDNKKYLHSEYDGLKNIKKLRDIIIEIYKRTLNIINDNYIKNINTINNKIII